MTWQTTKATDENRTGERTIYLKKRGETIDKEVSTSIKLKAAAMQFAEEEDLTYFNVYVNGEEITEDEADKLLGEYETTDKIEIIPKSAGSSKKR